MSVAFVLGIVGFALALGAAIALHELGHLLTAKAFGMKATEFFVGFGQKIWSFRRGETEYGLKAVPAGGYVKIVGMVPTEQVDLADEPRVFWRQPAWKRLVVLSAGSATHFLLAFLTLVLAALTTGLPDLGRGGLPPEVGAVSPCVVADAERFTTDDPDDAGCRPSDPVSPAARAGLREGDRVLAVDGAPVETFEDLVVAIRETDRGGVDLLLERDGARVEVAVALAEVEREVVLADGTTELQTFGQIGVAPPPAYERVGPVTAVVQGADGVRDLVVATGEALVTLPERVPNLWESLFFGEERDPEGVISVVGATRLGGQAVDAGLLVAAFTIFAGINIFIGIFNMVPLLPLDGGHVAVVVYERVRAWLARVRGRADPGPVDANRLAPLTVAVIAVVGVFSLLAISADIFAPLADPFQR